jgi:uncharacterized membrane protein
MEDSSEEKSLRMTSFVAHATRGVVRDQNTRRKTMFVLLVAALVLLVSGSTVLQNVLNPREHLGWFVFFWAACAWFAVTAMLLAVYDMLVIKRNERRAQRELRRKVAGSQSQEPKND